MPLGLQNSLFYNNKTSFGNSSSNVSEKQNEVNTLRSELQGFESNIFSITGEKNGYESQKSSAISHEQTTSEAVSNAKSNLTSANSAMADALSIPIETITNPDGTTKKDSSKRDEAIRIAQTLINAAKEELNSANADNKKAKLEVEKVEKQIQDAQKKLNEIKQDENTTKTKLNNAENELDKAQKEEKTKEKEEKTKEKEEKTKEKEEKTKEKEEKEEKEKTDNKDDKSSFFKNFEFNPFKKDDEKENDENKKEKGIINTLNNFFNLDGKDPEIEDSDFLELGENAKRILNPELYSNEELEEAKDDIQHILFTNRNAKNEENKKYFDLAMDLKSYTKNENERKKEEIEKEILDIFEDVNTKNGVSKETINAVKLAFEEIGVSEDLDVFGNGHNTGEMLKYGGRAGDAWCASFVSWLYGEGQENNNSDTFGYDIGVRFIRKDAINAKEFEYKDNYEPVAGDIMIQEELGASHTGMVVKTDDKYVYTIEGNAGDKVRAKKYDKSGEKIKEITGYVKMNEWNGSSTKPINIDFLPDEKYEEADKDKKQSTL